MPEIDPIDAEFNLDSRYIAMSIDGRAFFDRGELLRAKTAEFVTLLATIGGAAIGDGVVEDFFRLRREDDYPMAIQTRTRRAPWALEDDRTHSRAVVFNMYEGDKKVKPKGHPFAKYDLLTTIFASPNEVRLKVETRYKRYTFLGRLKEFTTIRDAEPEEADEYINGIVRAYMYEQKLNTTEDRQEVIGWPSGIIDPFPLTPNDNRANV